MPSVDHPFKFVEDTRNTVTREFCWVLITKMNVRAHKVLTKNTRLRERDSAKQSFNKKFVEINSTFNFTVLVKTKLYTVIKLVVPLLLCYS